MDFPIVDLLDDERSSQWLLKHFHPNGLKCPHCGAGLDQAREFRHVEVIHPDTPVQDAAKKMKELDVGSLPVCDGQWLVGTLTDRDIVIRAVVEGRNPATTSVREIMTPEVINAFEDQDVKEAAKLMQEKQIRRLPIISRTSSWLVSSRLATWPVDTGKEKMVGEALTEVSEPSQPMRQGNL